MKDCADFAAGLAMLRIDDDGPDAEAALQILAETILLHRDSLTKR